MCIYINKVVKNKSPTILGVHKTIYRWEREQKKNGSISVSDWPTKRIDYLIGLDRREIEEESRAFEKSIFFEYFLCLFYSSVNGIFQVNAYAYRTNIGMKKYDFLTG